MDPLLQPRVERVLQLVANGHGLTCAELIGATGYSEEQIHEYLANLVRFSRVIPRREAQSIRYYRPGYVPPVPVKQTAHQPEPKQRMPRETRRGQGGPVQQRILIAIRGETTIPEIAERTGLTPIQVGNSLYFLRQKGLVQKIRHGVYVRGDIRQSGKRGRTKRPTVRSKILDAMRPGQSMKGTDLARTLGMKYHSTCSYLSVLAKTGEVQKVKRGVYMRG